MNTVRIVLALCIIASNCYSQSSPGLVTITPPSPEASSLGKYGEVPVGLYTGIPNINIPIHTLNSRTLEVPITMSYHAGGIKVEEISSWVGLGWSLSAGGVITRSVRGVPDDMATGYFTSRSSINALAQKSEYMDYVATPYEYDMTVPGNGLEDDRTELNQILSGTLDSAPDIFYFNFGKYSGKFFMDSNGDFVSIPLQAMKIEYESPTVPGVSGATRWKVTMEDGVKYIFGVSLDGARNAIESNNNGGLMVPNTGWYLVEIISPSNDRIDLYYTPEAYNYDSKSSEVTNTVLEDNGNCNLPNFEKLIATNYFDGVKLERISGASGEVVFISSTNERADLPGSYPLESIEIRDRQATTQKKYTFSYSYFSSTGGCPTAQSYCKRLRLDKVASTSADGLTSSGDHLFGYNSTPPPAWDPAGTGLNSINAQDMWGYYNGASNDVLPRGGVVNLSSGQHTIEGGQRHSSENFMKAGVLTEIVYPTGGRTILDYEGNKLYASPATLGVVLEPVGKSASLVLISGDTDKMTDFSIGSPYPVITGPALVTINLRQQVQNCPPSTAGVPNCYEAYIERSDGTERQYLFEGPQTIPLYPGNYRIGGSTFPQVEGTNAPKVYYVQLNWLETPEGSPYAERDMTVGGLRIKRITTISESKNSVKKYLYSKFNDIISSGTAVHLNMLSAEPIVTENYVDDPTTCLYIQSKTSSLVPLIPTLGGIIGYANVTELIGENGEGGKTEYTYTTAADHPDEIKNFRPFPQSCSYDWRRGLLKLKSVFRKDPSEYVKIHEVENTYDFNNNVKTGYGLAVSKDIFSNITVGIQEYYVAGYKTVSEFSYLSTEKTRNYDPNNSLSYTESIRGFQYGVAPGHYQLIQESSFDSQGHYVEKITKYPQDVTLTGESETARQNMISNFILNPVMEQLINKDATLVTKTINDYKIYSSGQVHLASISQQNGAGPLEERVTISNYDGFGNPIQQAKKDDVQHSYIWGYNETYPIAEVANAESEDIAFTSFESDGSGNWIIGSSNRDLVYARTGNKSYSLADGTVSKTGVALGKKYTLSFWAKTGASIIINGATASPSPATAINDWQYYELTVTGSGSVTSVSISGTGIIDELRWLPVGAQMTTYAIDPGVGITAITDPNNATTYYDYDSVGRLKLIKNDKGEIVKMSDYYYQIR